MSSAVASPLAIRTRASSEEEGEGRCTVKAYTHLVSAASASKITKGLQLDRLGLGPGEHILATNEAPKVLAVCTEPRKRNLSLHASFNRPLDLSLIHI